MTTDQPTTSKPRRRWFQFSLRTLLVLVTVLCVWLAVTANRARKQREAVAAIEAVGGKVYYFYQRDSSDTWLPRAKPPGPEWLRGLVGEEYFVSVHHVYLSNTQVTDAGLEHLKGLNKLVQLELRNTQVTDAGLVHLKGLTNLQYLFLSSTQVTDDGLEHLKGLNKLVQLELVDTQVTDADVQKLQQIFSNCVIVHYIPFF